jgi:hypothetical protein
MSAKSVAAKLLVKPNTSFWLSHVERLGLLEPLPEDVRVIDRLDQAFTAVMFADSAEALRALLATHAAALSTPNALWIAYPKANRIDVNRDTLWPILAERGLRPITQVAIDAVWSALRFRPLKDGEAMFTAGEADGQR